MPRKPKHFCNHSGCVELVDTTYCEKHTKIKDERINFKRREYDKTRPAYYKLYDSKRWRVLRQRVFYVNPFCVHCALEGVVTAASVVDHIVPHKGNLKLFWDGSNLQGLCARCHSIKTSKEDSWNL